MTTPQDPFAAPSGNPTPPPPAPPAPPAPGLVAGAVPAVAPPATTGYGAYRPEPPKTFALWTIILTGVVTLISIVGAITAPAALEQAKEILLDPNQAANAQTASVDVLDYLVIPIQIGAFVLLALWWGRVRQVRAADGYQAGGIPAVEWWGWFVPIANYVLPALGMRSITKGLTGLGPLLGWWLAWCAYWTTTIISAVSVSVGTIANMNADGTLDNVDFIDGQLTWTYAGVAFLVISWAFLAYIVQSVTAKLASPAQAA